VKYIVGFFMILAVVLGECLGFALPLRLWRKVPGFTTGVFCGGLPALLAGVMAGYLLGGWAEALLGLSAVPVGLLIGGFLGTASVASLAGFLAAFIAHAAGRGDGGPG
jgi:hypothetical protein